MMRCRALLPLLLLALAACAGPAGPRAPVLQAAPSVRIPEHRGGIEVWWWVVEDPSGDLGDTLASYREPDIGTFGAANADLWAANGLRLLSIPRAEVDSLRQKLHLIGPIQSQWLGEVPVWTSIVEGPDVRRAREVALDDASVYLDPGPLRLLARAWVVARIERGSVEPRIHLELVPQHEDGRKGPGAGAASEGALFDRLRLVMDLDASKAILIVPEKPGVVWGSEAAADPVLGPWAAGLPSMGEEMLCAIRPDGGPPTARIFVVIVPTTPREFRLIDPGA